ncbi:mercury resistance system transport protein MerF [Alkalihalobacillus macyae]|uniref:mercury resistance system transport protein MerF n=1 Tax=Guptibacillus hwajinpoensis TaxID=208199 RepID=UPI00273CA019|nr:mercury resistance system transport protein MerF [Alkalihalobacillus macyae]MDP4551915.1 mercury resistance system transport protein MerF [Alkalihalobacillus macyae]
MKRNKTFITGIVGTIIALICCTTPVLVILLGTLGLGALTGYLDFVLIPALMIFMVITFFSYRKITKSSNEKENC